MVVFELVLLCGFSGSVTESQGDEKEGLPLADLLLNAESGGK